MTHDKRGYLRNSKIHTSYYLQSFSLSHYSIKLVLPYTTRDHNQISNCNSFFKSIVASTTKTDHISAFLLFTYTLHINQFTVFPFFSQNHYSNITFLSQWGKWREGMVDVVADTVSYDEGFLLRSSGFVLAQ